MWSKCKVLFTLFISIFILNIISGCTDDEKSQETISIDNTKNVISEVYKAPEVKTLFTPQPTSTEKPKEILKINAVGDILLGRGVGMRLKQQNKSFNFAFEKVADILKSGDVVFANLEEPVTSSNHSLIGVKEGGKYILKNDVESFEALKYAGFNIFSMANNHIMDFYEKGLLDTIDILDKNNIPHAGSGRNLEEARSLAVIEKKGLKIGVLSYTDMANIVYKGSPQISFAAEANKSGVAPRKFEYIKEDIEKSRDKVDILIISLHWGVEESFNILQEQRDFAYELLDLGADMILGHHPHQFQGIEMHNGKPIVYSMGNFIFDQNDPENQETFILNFDYEDNKLIKVEAVPVRTIGKIQVVPVKGNEAEELLNRELELSKRLGSECRIDGDKLSFAVD